MANSHNITPTDWGWSLVSTTFYFCGLEYVEYCVILRCCCFVLFFLRSSGFIPSTTWWFPTLFQDPSAVSDLSVKGEES